MMLLIFFQSYLDLSKLGGISSGSLAWILRLLSLVRGVMSCVCFMLHTLQILVVVFIHSESPGNWWNFRDCDESTPDHQNLEENSNCISK